MRWGALVVVFALAGCYEPKIDGCNVACDVDQTCPEGFTCNGGLCRAALEEDRCGGVPTLATGARHACVVQGGLISCWGANDFGQVDGSEAPMPIITTRTTVGSELGLAWLTVDAGSRHTCAIGVADGVRRVVCWGANDFGQSGGGPGTTGFTEIDVPDPVEVSSGGNHSCARTREGRLFCWGANGDGELGFGEMSPFELPREVRGNRTDWARVAVGNGSTCATRNDGSVHCWGRNNASQLGIGIGGLSELDPQPVVGAVFDPASPVRSLAVGTGTACIVHDDGANGPILRCWGDNRERQAGQLDIDEVVDATDPIAGFGSMPGWIDVRAGDRFACAMAADRQVYCWGREDARLGDNCANCRVEPGPDTTKPLRDGIDEPLRRAISFDVGDAFGCALFEGEPGPRCWGSNSLGQLGNGETTTVEVAAPITPPDDWLIVRVGSQSTCALRDDGTRAVFCWGDNSSGQSNPTSTETIQLAPSAVDGLIGTPFDVGMGDDHACVLLDDGTTNVAQCWGSNAFHELGVADVQARTSTPILPPPSTMGDRWSQIAAAQNVTCVISGGFDVACWGTASWLAGASVPTIIPELDGLSKLRLGPDGGCGLDNVQQWVCWGSDAAGLRGDGATTSPAFPVTPIANQISFSNISDSIAGHRCGGIVSMGSGFCWGDNSAHQVGVGNDAAFDSPQSIGIDVALEIDPTKRTIAAGRAFTCAVREDAAIVCWGDNSLLQGTMLGGNDGMPRAIAVDGVSSGSFGTVSAGDAHACAIDTSISSQLLCWGSSSHGQTGTGTSDPDFVVDPI